MIPPSPGCVTKSSISSALSWDWPPLFYSHHCWTTTIFQGNWRLRCWPVPGHMTEYLSLICPLSFTRLLCTSSALTLYQTSVWESAGHLETSRLKTCHTGRIKGGGGWSHTIRRCYLWYYSAQFDSWSWFNFLLYLGTPQMSMKYTRQSWGK